MNTQKEGIGARTKVIFSTIMGARMRGIIVMRAKAQGYWVIRPEGRNMPVVVHEMDIISACA